MILGDIYHVLNEYQKAIASIEIAGISSYFLRDKAKAVMASLWKVKDVSTSLLMQTFYSNLANGTPQAPITKATALRKAQLSLLYSKVSPMANVSQRTIRLAVSLSKCLAPRG